jgi:phytol kinase
MSNFWINELIKVLVFFSSTFLLGKFLVAKGVRVNYTRKIFHFIFFFFPIFLAAQLPFKPTLFSTLLSGIVLIVCLGLMWQPIRTRSHFLSTAYSAIDRPEDRPYTLIWISTQIVATYLALIGMVYWLSQYEKTSLIYITVLVAGIGDGLAEPVGVRFGKRKYTVGALFTDKQYTRTLEGSLCVFASGIFAVALMSGQLDKAELILAYIFIPIAMTLAEARSPHTWDGPFLYLAGGIATVAVLELAPLINLI